MGKCWRRDQGKKRPTWVLGEEVMEGSLMKADLPDLGILLKVCPSSIGPRGTTRDFDIMRGHRAPRSVL